MRLRVYLAGNVALERGSVLVPERGFPGRQGRLAFAVLAWERARAVSVDELAEIVWDGAPPAAWQTGLRAIVSKLRRVLAEAGPEVTIEHAFGCYQLRLPGDAWMDVEAAAEAVHDAETAHREGDLEHAMGAALVANAIARRPLLPGDAGAWVGARRERLRQLRVRALEVRAAIALHNGDTVGAAGDATIVIDLEPYRETGYVLLMRAHAGAGNRAQALAVYDGLRTRLAEDLGTSPSGDAESFFLELLGA